MHFLACYLYVMLMVWAAVLELTCIGQSAHDLCIGGLYVPKSSRVWHMQITAMLPMRC